MNSGNHVMMSRPNEHLIIPFLHRSKNNYTTEMKPSANDTSADIAFLGPFAIGRETVDWLLTSQQLSHAHDAVKVRSEVHGNLSAV